LEPIGEKMKKIHLASLSKADEWILTKTFLPYGKKRLQRILDAPDDSILMYLYYQCYQKYGGKVCAEAIALGMTIEDFIEFEECKDINSDKYKKYCRNSWHYLRDKAEQEGIKIERVIWEPFLYSSWNPKPWWASEKECKDILIVMNEIEVSLLKDFIKHRLMNYRQPEKWGKLILSGLIGLGALFYLL